MTRTPPLSTPMRNRLREEALYGRLPLLKTERSLNTWRMTLGGLSAAVGAWCFLIGGYCSNFVGATAGSAALIAGSVLGVTLSAATALCCNRYGLDTTDASKPCFGQRGAKLLLSVQWISQIGFAGLTLIMFGRCTRQLLGLLHNQRTDAVVSLMVLIGLAVVYVALVRGIGNLGALYQIATPALAMVAGTVVYVIFRDVSWADLTRIPPLIGGPDARLNTVQAFEVALGAGFCWWPSIGSLTRSADNQRVSFYPLVATLGLAVGLMACMGLFAALLFRNYDPTTWLTFVGGRTFGALTLVLVATTNLMACASLLYSATLSLRHMRRLRPLAWPVLVAMACIPLSVCVGAPTFIYEHGGVMLALNAALLAPAAGVLCVDYFFLRRQRLNLTHIFEDARDGRYWYHGGFNVAALGSIVVGSALSLWMNNPMAHTVHSPVRALGASGPALVLSAMLYMVFARLWLIPSGHGGYDVSTRPEPLKRPNL